MLKLKIMENQDEFKRLITEIVSVRKEIIRVQEQIDNKHVELQNAKTALQAMCPHEEVYKQTKTYSGGYLHKGSYVTTYICTICELEVDRTVEEGSYE